MRVWCGGDYRAALDVYTLRIDPSIPESGECEHLTIANLEAEWLLGFSVARPLIETIRRNQAALRPDRIAE